jgi:hypothetical protein
VVTSNGGGSAGSAKTVRNRGSVIEVDAGSVAATRLSFSIASADWAGCFRDGNGQRRQAIDREIPLGDSHESELIYREVPRGLSDPLTKRRILDEFVNRLPKFLDGRK